MPKTKAYVIITDGNDILVGEGGTAGGKPRGGFHLPGGTVNQGETPAAAVVRETLEETGIPLPAPNPLTVRQYGQTTVHFFYVAVSSSQLQAWASSPPPSSGTPWDSPFASLQVVTPSQAQVGFKAKFWTDWFADGLREAQTQRHVR